ncbi:hypothetical protein HN873_063598 [Arachis hypogaea]
MISSGRFSSGAAFSSCYNLRCFLQRSSPAAIFSGGDLLHQCFSSIGKICCASVSCGIELSSATSPSPSSFVEHLGFRFSSLSEEIGGQALTKFSSNFVCMYARCLWILMIVIFFIKK